MPSGVYKPAYFVTLASPSGNKQTTGTPPISPDVHGISISSPVFVEESSIDIYKQGQSFSVPPAENADWVVNVTLAVRSSTDFQSPSITLAFSELDISKTFQVPEIHASPAGSNGSNSVNVVWRISDSIPKRWYPHNLGKPQLYNLSVALDLRSKGNIVDSVSFQTRTGFRTIQLVQSPYNQDEIEGRGIIPGDNWHFNINGKPFYALGTNIIPFDPFYARTTTDQVRWVLESAVKTGQNMVNLINVIDFSHF